MLEEGRRSVWPGWAVRRRKIGFFPGKLPIFSAGAAPSSRRGFEPTAAKRRAPVGRSAGTRSSSSSTRFGGSKKVQTRPLLSGDGALKIHLQDIYLLLTQLSILKLSPAS